MEISTEENEEIVRKIAGDIIGESNKPGNPPDTEELRLFFDVYILDMEIGSGASFEQYFRWAEKDQIKNIVGYLEILGLDRLAEVTSAAINIAFPNGVPEDEDELDELTVWTEEQEEALNDHYEQVGDLHGVVANRLGEYAKEKGLMKLSRFHGLFKLDVM